MNEHLSTDRLIDYIHGELRAEDDASVHAHLRTCAPCRTDYEAEVALSEVLRAEPAFAERELPGAVRGAIWAAVDAERPPVGARIAAFFRPVIAVPVAAAAIAIAVFASPLGHPNQAGPRVDAAYYLEAHAAQQAQNPFAEHGSTGVIETSMLDGGSTTATDGGGLVAAGAAPSLSNAAAGTLDVVQ